MTTDPTSHESTSKEGGRSKWMDDAETAITEVRSALQAAWEESRDARGSALETARVAAKQLGEAIDQGIGAARQRWEASRGDEESTATSTQPGEPTPPTSTATTPPATPRPDDPTPQSSSPSTPVTPTDPTPPAPDTSSPDQTPNA